MARKREDLTGRVFWRLKVIGFAELRYTHSFWLCVCECGRETTVNGSVLKRGGAKSCGCWRSDSMTARNKARRGDPWLAEMNTYVSRLGYDKRKSRQGLEKTWMLTLEQYKALSLARCFYCGSLPNTPPHTKLLKKEGVKRNGIDRVDNSAGYTPDNCVPCCRECNYEKGTRTMCSFIERTLLRHKHLQKHEWLQPQIERLKFGEPFRTDEEYQRAIGLLAESD